jgi:hypothetical protein
MQRELQIAKEHFGFSDAELAQIEATASRVRFVR